MISKISTTLLLTMLATSAHAAEAHKPQSNKEIVRAFYEMAFTAHKPKEAAETYLAPDYIQHNPSVPNGRQPFIDFFVPYFAKNKSAKSEIKRVIADGDLVALHVHSTNGKADRGRAIVDIFRVKNGKIVEHWDVIQAIPEKSANANGMF